MVRVHNILKIKMALSSDATLKMVVELEQLLSLKMESRSKENSDKGSFSHSKTKVLDWFDFVYNWILN